MVACASLTAVTLPEAASSRAPSGEGPWRPTTLLFVGLNPPLTSGARTRARVELARGLLGFESVQVANLFALPTRDLAGIVTAGDTEHGWSAARTTLAHRLPAVGGVLLGYGVQAPSGSARQRFRDQVAWLEALLTDVGLPVWQVGGQPRHPSRWQRHTHRTRPGKPFPAALAAELRRRDDSHDENADAVFRAPSAGVTG